MLAGYGLFQLTGSHDSEMMWGECEPTGQLLVLAQHARSTSVARQVRVDASQVLPHVPAGYKAVIHVG